MHPDDSKHVRLLAFLCIDLTLKFVGSVLSQRTVQCRRFSLLDLMRLQNPHKTSPQLLPAKLHRAIDL